MVANEAAAHKRSHSILTAFLGVALAAAMAIAMVPATALANDDWSNGYFPTGLPGIDNAFKTGSITPYNGTIDVAAGDQIDMTKYFTPDVQPWEDAAEDLELVWHIDYMITEGSQYASVNKHSGELTGIEPGDVTVAAYLIPYIENSTGPNTLCYHWTYVAYDHVTVTEATAYGYQGGSNALILDSVGSATPTKITPSDVTVAAGSSMEKGFTNTLVNSVPSEDGYVYFTYQTIAGFKNYATADAYAAYNAGNISLKSGFYTYNLTADNSGPITIAAVDADAQQVTVKIAKSSLTGNTGSLVFHSGLKANNAQRTLETEVTFNFTVAS